MEGVIVGIFGSDVEAQAKLASSVAKKSEAEGVIVYTRPEGGRRISFLYVEDFPDRIQGCAKVASLSDHAYFLLPREKLSSSDGELAVLLDSFGLQGTAHVQDSGSDATSLVASLKGTVGLGIRPKPPTLRLRLLRPGP